MNELSFDDKMARLITHGDQKEEEALAVMQEMVEKDIFDDFESAVCEIAKDASGESDTIELPLLQAKLMAWFVQCAITRLVAVQAERLSRNAE